MRASKRSRQGVFSHPGLRKASAAHTAITGLGGSAGIAVKEVLNLHRFYTGSPHGVAMQVYAGIMQMRVILLP